MSNETLDYKYKEMVRLAEKSDEYAKSSFEDFKMLSAVGTLLAFKPATIFLDFNGIGEEVLLISGFLAILFIIAFIGFFGLMKQAIVNFYLGQIIVFEKEVRKELNENDHEIQTFRVAENWKLNGRIKQRNLAKKFYSLFYFVISIYPTVIIYIDTKFIFAFGYFVTSMLIVALHYTTAKMVHTD